MSNKNVKKIGFFSALCICVGSMVGIGIFVKNISVGKNVEGDGVGWLIAWILSALIALLVAINFARISRIENNKKVCKGLSDWVDYIFKNKSKQKWFIKIVSLNYGFFYNSILVVALSFFSVEILVSFIDSLDPSQNINLNIWLYILISLCFALFFIFINYLSLKASGIISIISTVLKFIPLIATILIGLIFANEHNYSNGTVNGENGFLIHKNFETTLKGIMLSIPSILFAFDSFLGVGVMANELKGGHKNVSKIMIFGMLFVAIIYLLLCLTSIFHFNVDGTSITNVLIDSLPANIKNSIIIIINFFLFVSAFGTTNAITSVGVKEFEAIIEKQLILVPNFLKKFSLKIQALFYQLISLFFWMIIIYLPSGIINSDALVDGFSNFVVIFFFLIYAYTIFYFWKYVYKKEEKFQKIYKRKTQCILTYVATIGVVLAIGLNVFFIFWDAIATPFNQSSWGLYLSNKGIDNLTVLFCYILITPFFIFLPVIIDKYNLLIKKAK